MGLTILVQHRRLGIASHACRPDLVNNDAAIGNPIRTRSARSSRAQKRPAAGFDDGAKSFLHILCHLDFVITPLPVKAQHRNAPLVDCVGIDIAVTVLVGNHLATAFEADKSSVHTAALLLQIEAVPLELIAHAVKLADTWHGPSAVDFYVVSTQKIIFAIEFPPWNINMHSADAVMIVRMNLL